MADPQGGQHGCPGPARRDEPAPPRSSPGASAKPPSVMRSLGEFFGHIGKAVRTPVTPALHPPGEPPSPPATAESAAPQALDPRGSPVRRRVVSEIVEEREVEPGRSDPREAVAGENSAQGPAQAASNADDPGVRPPPGMPARMILRRTVVEEVEIRPDDPRPEQRPS